MSAAREVRVGVVGAGLGGVAVAVSLRRAGIRTFTVFERGAGPGGVWWHNTYPGCEVDIATHCYSYSFMPYDWPRTHARQAELQAYVEDVIDTFDVRGHFRFGDGVQSVRWDDAAGAWEVLTDSGERHNFDVVVSCVGLLSHPNIPNWPGLDEFAGPVFHTARYEHHHDLSDKRVAVVGTGSTACQLVPAIAGSVGHLDLYQREPGWVLEKRAREFTPDERRRFTRQPWRQKIERYRYFRYFNELLRASDAGGKAQEKWRSMAERYIRKSIPDPALQKAVTPTYAYGCKRVIFAEGFYSALCRDNVELVPHAVAEVTRTGLVDATGTERPADVIILATGFQASNFLATLPVTGPGGRRLQDAWGDEPRAFLGMTVNGFPNFFVLYGPNTNGGGSLIHQLERQAEVVTRMVRRLQRRPGGVVETRPAAERWFDRAVQRRIETKLSALVSGCHSYYFGPTGRNVTQWPGGAPSYWLATKLLAPLGLVVTPRNGAAGKGS